METKVTAIDPMKEVKNLGPVIRKHSDEAEKNRKISEPVLKALKESGLFGLWRPKVYGGLETDPITGYRVIEELSKIDPSVGWNLSLSISVESILQWFSDDAHRDVYSSEEEMIIAGSWNPPGKAIPVEGG